MLADDPTLKPQHRMPRVFGALPGPRNVPADKQHLPNRQTGLSLAVTVASDAARLQALLPPRCRLQGEPLFTVTLSFLHNIGWMGGHGYNILSVLIPIAYQSPSRGLLTGNFLPVVWENLADPILTGREELGWSKLYADLPPLVSVGDAHAGKALWQGFRFLDIGIAGLAPAPLTVPPAGQFHYRYFPRPDSLIDAEVEYLEYAAPGETVGGYVPPAPTARFTGQGHVQFHLARWEDMPFQYPIINALSALPVLEIRGATLTHSAASGAIGNPGPGALRRID